MLPYTIGKFSEAVIPKHVRSTEHISAIVNADGDRKTEYVDFCRRIKVRRWFAVYWRGKKKQDGIANCHVVLHDIIECESNGKDFDCLLSV